MFNYIFNAIKVKLAVRNAVKNLRSHGHELKVVSVDNIVGIPGKKVEDWDGYMLESGKYSMAVIIDSDKVTELILLATLTSSNVGVRSVRFSFYKGVGDCYDGKPDGWVSTPL